MENVIKAQSVSEAEQLFLLPVINVVTEDIKHELSDSQHELIQFSNVNSLSDEASVAEVVDSDSMTKLYEELKESAYRDGYAKGLSVIDERYGHLVDKLDMVINSLDEAIPNYVNKNQLIIVSIVFEAISKILGVKLADKAISIEVVKTIINSFDINTITKIHLSPRDLDELRQLQANLEVDGVAFEMSILLGKAMPDSNVLHGGCKIHLKDGFVDASIESQLKSLINHLSSVR